MDEAVTYAGFWVRVGATLIDALLIALVTMPIFVSVYGSGFFLSEEIVQGKVDFLLTWVLPAVAVITFWVLKSATPGKMVFSAVIVDARTGGKLSVAQCVGRYFAYIPATLVLFLGLIWVGIDKRKQGWHDKLASTVVIRKKPAPVVFTRPESD